MKILRQWMLPIAMIAGSASYFVYSAIPFSVPFTTGVETAVGIIQPALIFIMLFLSFCKIAPHDLKLHRGHFVMLAVQMVLFALFSLLAVRVGKSEAGTAFFGRSDLRFTLEGFMLCMVCPTATAAAVVTPKLGGDTGSVVSYTLICNLAVAVLAPVMLPIVNPQGGLSFINAFAMIMGKVFPLLICPLILAWFVRFFFPKLHRKILSYPDAAFYIWAVSLTLAIAVTMKSIVHSRCGAGCLLGIAGASLLCCIFQFWFGKKAGARHNDALSSSQAMGQKNTVFAMWMGYTFMSPVASVAGGFYSLWHNLYNSWQLYRKEKADNSAANLSI